MKITTTLLTLALGLWTLDCSAQFTITNVNIGVDSSSNAWSKVNYNNNNFVSWLNADNLTNGFFLSAVTTASSVATGTAASFLAVSNHFVTVSNNYAAVSNNFVIVSNQYASGLAAVPADSVGNGHWGTNGMNLQYITPVSGYAYYGIGGNGIANGDGSGFEPTLGVAGWVMENANDGLTDFAWAANDGAGESLISSVRFETRGGSVLTGGSKEFQFGWSGNYVGGFGWVPCMILGDNYSTATEGFSIGEGSSPTTPPASGLHVVGNVQFDAAFSSDAGTFTSDGSGNVTAQTFTPVSDRALKENITALPPGHALDMALALTNFQWNFRARTNRVAVLTRQAGFTNGVAKINFAATNIASASAIAKKGLITTTNVVEKIAPASGRQIGPMAQDWHAVTGLDDGRHISLTAMQGLLLGAIQDLAARQPAAGTVTNSTDTTSGHGGGLIRWDTNYLYVSVGTNQWKRATLTSW